MIRCLPGQGVQLSLIKACFTNSRKLQRRRLSGRPGFFLKQTLRLKCTSATVSPPLRSLGTFADVQQHTPESQNGSKSTTLTFQEAIVQLQEYWTSVGCTLWQPHNSEVLKQSALKILFERLQTSCIHTGGSTQESESYMPSSTAAMNI